MLVEAGLIKHPIIVRVFVKGFLDQKSGRCYLLRRDRRDLERHFNEELWRSVVNELI